MIHGPDLPTLRAAAKAAVMAHYVAIADGDGVPPTLRAFYVLKVAEARTLLEGGASDYIAKEAGLRGVQPADLAAQIVAFSAASEALELDRMRANIALDAAADESAIHAVIDPLGVAISLDA